MEMNKAQARKPERTLGRERKSHGRIFGEYIASFFDHSRGSADISFPNLISHPAEREVEHERHWEDYMAEGGGVGSVDKM